MFTCNCFSTYYVEHMLRFTVFYFHNLTSCWRKRKCQVITRVSRVNPIDTMNVCAKFHGNLSHNCWDIWVCTNLVKKLRIGYIDCKVSPGLFSSNKTKLLRQSLIADPSCMLSDYACDTSADITHSFSSSSVRSNATLEFAPVAKLINL